MADNKIKLVKFAPFSLYKRYENEDDYGLLTWSIRAGYPRISVFTSNIRGQNEKFDYNKLITAPFDILNVSIFINQMKEALQAKNGTRYQVKCYNTKFFNGVRTKDVYLQAIAEVGKDKDGVLFLAVLEEGKRKIKFDMLPNTKWHNWAENGENIDDKAKLSKMFATAYVNGLERVLGDTFASIATVETEIENKAIIKVEKPSSDTTDAKEKALDEELGSAVDDLF